MPPTSLATTAAPQAMASRLTRPKGSYTEGQTKTLAWLSSCTSSLRATISSTQTTDAPEASAVSWSARTSPAISGVSEVPATSTSWARRSICAAARRRWESPFWRVIRPTKTTSGRPGSMPRRSRAASPRSGRYSSASIPLWMTWTRPGSTAG